MAVGAIVGSNMFNILLVLAIPGLAGSLSLQAAVVSRDMVAVFLTTLVLALAALWRWNGASGSSTLGRGTGLLLLSLYIAYYGWPFSFPDFRVLKRKHDQPHRSIFRRLCAADHLNGGRRRVCAEQHTGPTLCSRLSAHPRHNWPRGGDGHGQKRTYRRQNCRHAGQHGHAGFFVHPGEASHGDMGMITASDCVIALSNSGSTHEILTLCP